MAGDSTLFFVLIPIALFMVAVIGGLALLVRAVVVMANMPAIGGAPSAGQVCAREGCGEFNPFGAQYCRRCGAVLAERSAA